MIYIRYMKLLIQSLKWEKENRNVYIILLSAPVLLTLYWYHGDIKSFVSIFKYNGDPELLDFFASVWQFFVFFFLMLVLPLMYIKFRMKKKIKDFGFGLGDRKFGFRLVLIVIPLIILPIMYFASGMEDLQNEYPLSKAIIKRHDLIFIYEILYIILYYITWEFYFRGFLLFGLKNKFGATAAILIQTISSCLIHLGKPEGEIIGSIIIGILFGYIALRTKSIWYVFLMHAAIGVLIDLFIIF